METVAWHSRTVDEVLTLLNVGSDGLSTEEARQRLSRYGPNELMEQKRRSPLSILSEQFTNVMVVVLVVAAVISGLTGDLKDAIVISVILVLNALLGFFQEYRAEKAMTALKKLAVPVVRVTRGGQVQEISSRELVPGDILHLETGGHVGADARLIDATNLSVEEAALTGESVPVEKDARAVSTEEAPLGDRRSMVFMGTVVTAGRGRAVVVATGMQSELGRIADMIQSSEERKTPLQIRLAYLGKWLAVAALGVCTTVFLAGVWRGDDLKTMFLTAVSLAVAAIPESLPAVITVALALGAQRMIRRHALIRKLPAVETLGCVTAICSDKTGTLTQNKMTVKALQVHGKRVQVDGDGYNPIGEMSVGGQIVSPMADPELALMLRGMVLCNDAYLVAPADGVGSGWSILGDPTEGALLVVAAKAGLDKTAVETEMPRVSELQFDSDRKRMTTLHRYNGRLIAFTKGAVDGIVDLCSQIMAGGDLRALRSEDRAEILRATDELAENGNRVLAVAYREWTELPESLTPEMIERDLVYLGLVGMIDPPRQEAAGAVATCLAAGIKPVMITGDHRLTAEAVAREIGIMRNHGRSVAGVDVDKMDDDLLGREVESISVYSRVSPLHKMRIVEALQKRGHIVAMTGDGVNDAPALKRADIGVAMGISGTDVSKEAADMVLTDDNFATIVAAVKEGRAIYDNIRKFIRYMLTTNSAEVLTMFGAILIGLPLPILPIQILWINLVTDGLPALALGFEPAEPDVMRRPPRDPRESVFARGLSQNIVAMGLYMALVTLAMMVWGLNNGLSLETIRTMVFFTLATLQVSFVLAIRSERESFFTLGLRSNPYLAGAVALAFLLQLGVTYVPFLQPVFHTVPLDLGELAMCLGVAASAFVLTEAQKAVIRWRSARVGRVVTGA
ncbi:MAG: cation-translocating P-type ATPase [Chloroflexota bacterium]